MSSRLSERDRIIKGPSFFSVSPLPGGGGLSFKRC